jgi:hypothetical protein
MRTACILLCAVLLAAAYAPDARAQPQGPTAARVVELFDRAQAAYAKGDKQGAYEAYTAAWSLQKSYDIAGNLGVVELKLGKYRDAAEHLAFSLENFPPTGEEAQQRATEKKLAEALKEVGRVHVQVSPKGASVTVNGNAADTALVAGTLYVKPGAVVVEAKLAGYLDGRRQVEIAKGGEETVTLSLVPAPPPGPNKIVLATGGAVAGVGVVLGAVFAGLSNAKAADVAAKHDGIVKMGVTAACGPMPSAECQALQSAMTDRATFGNASAWSFISAGAVGAGTVIYALAAPRAAKTSGMHVVPLVAADGGGVVLRGEW